MGSYFRMHGKFRAANSTLKVSSLNKCAYRLKISVSGALERKCVPILELYPKKCLNDFKTECVSMQFNCK